MGEIYKKRRLYVKKKKSPKNHQIWGFVKASCEGKKSFRSGIRATKERSSSSQSDKRVF